MYLLPPVHELTIVGILEPGVPNRERIVLRPMQDLNLAGYSIVLSSSADGGIMPIPDQFFWFGESWVSPPAWVVVYTGPGAFTESSHPDTRERVLELHWGKANVAFGQPGIVASLVRIGGISSSQPPPVGDVPQPKRLRTPGQR